MNRTHHREPVGPREASPARGRVRIRVVRWLLLSLVFSGLQGLLGAWVVPWMADGAAVAEVCTPQGLQWVRLDAAASQAASPQEPPSGESGAQQAVPGCVWAVSHVSLPPVARMAGPVPARGAGTVPCDEMARVRPPGQDGPVRVLLMAPMRAPPCLT